ncbi:MAG TPA: hypothetical protein VJ281_01390 [Chthoniobacterales bacterium]|jgi:hypothetical protein|nr:hypothetical protein [Chthoniobacterales bacterium]
MPLFVPRVALLGDALALALGSAVADAEALGDAPTPGDGLFVGPAAGGGGLFGLFVALVCAFVCVCVFTPVVVLVAFEYPTPADTPKLE